ncbi:MAG: acetone carboxylase subunit alpha, partial [Nevskia sp.]|nr:acetone carboxylase subunit alpha [Nevskia sp.]
MNDMQKLSKDDQALLDKFLADNRLFLGPDPEIMRNHSVTQRSALEEKALS